MRRLKVLVSAYACEPDKGSEPEVGWNICREMAEHHDVWAITRENNRPAIEAALAIKPISGLRFVYYDLPAWARRWKHGQRGVHTYYYLWQCGAYFLARALHRDLRFDLTHHATFVTYWRPSFLALLPVPFVWGPVGGGESAPKEFWVSCGMRGLAYEALRELCRWFGEHDPLVRLTARRSTIALATTQESATRVERLGAQRVAVLPQVALSSDELCRLAPHAKPDTTTVTFISVGRLLHLKGFHLSLRAFAIARLKGAHYLIVGDGPERRRLEVLAQQLRISQSVRFLGWLSREHVLNVLTNSDVLVHPALHESGGWVCIEAMAAGKPVICLDLGGPAIQVTDETGIKVPPRSSEQVVAELVKAMECFAENPTMRRAMGLAARKRAEDFNCCHKAKLLLEFYDSAWCARETHESPGVARFRKSKDRAVSSSGRH